MADYDVDADTTPQLPFPSTTQGAKFPTVAALKTAISGSAFAARYPAATMQTMTKNDLIFVCRTHAIACVGI